MNKKKILIIDDDNRNIFALSATLKTRSFECVSSLSAEEAISLLKNSEHFDAILIDMMMPDMDGYEAIQVIGASETYGHVPVIAVTAQAMQGDREKCLDAGARAYVPKPIDLDLLIGIIEQNS